MPRPHFRSVYDDPDSHWSFIVQERDSDFEGQTFDRKEAGRAGADGSFGNSALSGIKDQVERALCGFANSSGGLLVVGITRTGAVPGIGHLSESQRSSLLDVSSLRGAAPIRKLHEVTINDETREIALFMVEPNEHAICERIRDGAAWIRRGPGTFRLQGDELEQLQRDRRVVDFERAVAAPYEERDVDTGVVEEFVRSHASRHERDIHESLRDAGAIFGSGETQEWTNAGLLFFASNPQRILSHARVRLLRFNCPYSREDERPGPDFDRDFDGSLTEQIRDLRTFFEESGFFWTVEERAPDGGFITAHEYPQIAVDEALVNAVAHRDYGINRPIVCEKYTDAFVVKSPGRLRQDQELPREFRLDEVTLDSVPRNVTLMNWLRAMKDAQGASYVRALREGTRSMRDEMKQLHLPAPLYKAGDVETVVVLENNAEERTPKCTGLAGQEVVESDEFTNLYPLTGFVTGGAREEERERTRIVLEAICDRLETRGWIVDELKMGRAVVHVRGAQESVPCPVAKVLRIIPAYALGVRSYFGHRYLAVDVTIRVQAIWQASKAVARFGADKLIGLNAFASSGGKPVRGRIVQAGRDHLRLRLFRENEEVEFPVNAIYPALRRNQIADILNEVAPDFDLARAIKAASLATARGAARQRAVLIGEVVEKIVGQVFPLSVGSREIGLLTGPLRLRPDGDGKRAWRVGEVAEPEVEFGHGRMTPNIRDGISTFGSYGNDPRDIEIVGVVEPGFEKPLRELVTRLQAGAFKFRGAERTFATRLKLASVNTAHGIRVDAECRRLISEYPEWSGNQNLNRLILVHTPEADFALDDVTSPYYEAKRILLEAGVPCQMVDSPTLLNPDYKDLNLALNIVAKTGTTPWVLPQSIPDADFFVGLSYTSSRAKADDRVLGFANVFNRYGRWQFYSGGNEAVPYRQREEHYERLVQETLARLDLGERPTVYFHYSARFGQPDREAILRGARTVRPHGRYVFVWINTHHPVRLFDRRRETDGSLARGRYAIGARNQIYLSTTGDNPYRKSLGTPQVLEVNVYAEEDGEKTRTVVDLRSVAKQILSLTKLNWASTDALCGEPITTKYAKDIAYLTSAFERQGHGGFRLHGALERTPWFI